MLIKIREAAVVLLLALWATAMAFVCATLMIGHWVPLPTPKVGTRPQFAFPSHASANEGWKVLHFLYSECTCSKRILNHLLLREPIQGIEETIVMVGGQDSHKERISDEEFHWDWVTPEELKSKYSVEAAPLLVVLDPSHTIRYSGAYTARKQGFSIQDVSLITRIRAGESVRPLILMGCGVSKELQSLTDPFGFKTNRN